MGHNCRSWNRLFSRHVSIHTIYLKVIYRIFRRFISRNGQTKCCKMKKKKTEKEEKNWTNFIWLLNGFCVHYAIKIGCCLTLPLCLDVLIPFVQARIALSLPWATLSFRFLSKYFRLFSLSVDAMHCNLKCVFCIKINASWCLPLSWFQVSLFLRIWLFSSFFLRFIIIPRCTQ